MKRKLLLTLSLAFVFVLMLALSVCAETITVVDDGTTEITLGECVIEDLDRVIPTPSRGFTYKLDTETHGAKITDWLYRSGDAENGVNFVIPSTVTYDGQTYYVTSFDRVTSSNKIVELIAIPDTVTAIPNNAFDSLGAVRYIYVGSGIETIGEGSFQWVGFAGDKNLVDENGDNIGDIREFIWKTEKVTTLTTQCFFHLDFNPDCIIEFPFEKITTYGDNCMAYNGWALTADHAIGRKLYIDVFDLRGATSVSASAFTNSALARTIIVNAEHTYALTPQQLGGGGSGQPDKYSTFIIYGGETPETAVTLTGSVWIANTYWWHPGDVHFSIVFRGYVNAYDGVDGLENQNAYGNDVVDYFFDSYDSFTHYIDSIDSTTERVNTYTRYAKNSNGYFNVCKIEAGVHSFTAYNLVYTAAAEGVEESVQLTEYAQANFKWGYPTYDVIEGDNCTASNLCWVCDFVHTAGVPHEYETTASYPYGYLEEGITRYGCKNCDHGTVSTLDPLFESKGFSSTSYDGKISIVQGFDINREAIDIYYSITGVKIKFGVVATSVNKVQDGKPGTEMAEGVVATDFTDRVEVGFTRFEIKVSEIESANQSIGLYACAYVIEGDDTYYLSENTCGKTVTAKTALEIVNQ